MAEAVAAEAAHAICRNLQIVNKGHFRTGRRCYKVYRDPFGMRASHFNLLASDFANFVQRY